MECRPASPSVPSFKPVALINKTGNRNDRFPKIPPIHVFSNENLIEFCFDLKVEVVAYEKVNFYAGVASP